MIEIGLDLETSGSDINAGAVPIELGLVIDDRRKLDRDIFDQRVGGWDWENDPIEWDINAERVHKINMVELDDAPPAHIVDCMAVAWLYPLVKDTPRMERIPVGWNVAGFDMPFVDRHFPQLRALLSYRSIDLNAIVLAMAGLGGDPTARYRQTKTTVKDYARLNAEQIGFEQKWHVAWFDAWAALQSLECLRSEYLT